MSSFTDYLRGEHHSNGHTSICALSALGRKSMRYCLALPLYFPCKAALLPSMSSFEFIMSADILNIICKFRRPG